MAENRELALVLRLVADQFSSELKKQQGALGEFNKFISDWKTQLTAVGVALFAIAKSTANYGDELVKASQRMGTSVEDTARLQHAARLSDTDLQGLTKTVGFLSKEMLAASTGNADAQRTFDMIGVSATTAGGHLKGTTDMLVEMGDKFRLMPEGPEKTALAMLALGKTGKEVLPLLNSHLREAFTEADKLGLVMSEKDARAAEHFNDELTKLQGAIRGVTNDVGTALIPKFDALAHAMTMIITDARAVALALGSIPQQPKISTLQPNEGGRRLRILPVPPELKGAVVDKVARTKEDFEKEEAHGKRLADQFIADWKVRQSLGKEQESLGKALQEIHLASERADEIANQQRMAGVSAYMLSLDRKIQRDEEDAAKQELLGLRIVERTKLEVSIRDEALARERDGLAQNAQAWIAYYDQLGGSTDALYTHKMDLLRANLAKELDLTQRQSAELLMAWQQRDAERANQILANSPKSGTEKETIELNTMRQSILIQREAGGDFFEGWSEGMRRYVKDTQSGFGMAADMARRTAQLMEQSFRTFFFDLFEGRIQSMKDVLNGLLNFVKQLMSQLAAQLATRAILGAFAGAGGGSIGGLAGSSGEVGGFQLRNGGGYIEPRRFASGGLVPGFGTGDTVPALLTPGELVFSRRDVSDLKRGLLGGGGSPINIAITVTAGGGSQQSGTGAAPNFTQLARELSRLVESKLIDEQRPGGLLAGGRA